MVEAYAKRTDKDQAARDTYEFNKKLNDYKTGVDVPSKNTTVLKYQAAYFLEHTVT
jgi:ABC-type Fe2+-enterobactin transport system substrate-binding protein